MQPIDLLGYSAGILVIVSLIPQMIKSWKSKSTKDISLLRYIIYTVGIFLWLVYAFLLNNGPMIFSNIIAIIFAGSILYMKFKYG
jgi:MtN3 and saliva related transmembrane protein